MQALFAYLDVVFLLQYDDQIVQALVFQVFMVENDEIQENGAVYLAFSLNEARFLCQFLPFLFGEKRGDGNIQFSSQFVDIACRKFRNRV